MPDERERENGFSHGWTLMGKKEAEATARWGPGNPGKLTRHFNLILQEHRCPSVFLCGQNLPGTIPI